MAQTTITDIAKELNITPSTVSRALAGSSRVKKATRMLVEEKAKEMGYERNSMAANLRKGVADIVGIIVPRINRQFFGSVISGAESVLKEAGYSVIICQTHERLEDEILAIKTMRRNQAAGILISHSIESENGEHIKDIIGDGTRLVQFDRIFSDLPGAKIVNDNFHGAYAATKHLIDKGYTKIGHIAGYMNCEHYKQRLEGYAKALKDNGIMPDEKRIFYNSILRETGYESGRKAIKAGCDAIYCSGDFSALGAIEAAKDAGLSVPEGIGIIGTANEDFTELMTPSISSLELHPQEIGRQAATAFLKNSEKRITVPMKLIIRESSEKTITNKI